jgi:hypothetical protein
MHAVRAFILLAALALPLGTTALAQDWDLTGEWTFHFTVEDGPTYSDPCYVKQEGNTLKGMVIYEEGGNQYKEPFEGAIDPEGTVTFVLYDAGEAVEHWGRILDDGNTVSGQWSFSGGQGAFTMTRN